MASRLLLALPIALAACASSAPRGSFLPDSPTQTTPVPSARGAAYEIVTRTRSGDDITCDIVGEATLATQGKLMVLDRGPASQGNATQFAEFGPVFSAGTRSPEKFNFVTQNDGLTLAEATREATRLRRTVADASDACRDAVADPNGLSRSLSADEISRTNYIITNLAAVVAANQKIPELPRRQIAPTSGQPPL